MIHKDSNIQHIRVFVWLHRWRHSHKRAYSNNSTQFNHIVRKRCIVGVEASWFDYFKASKFQRPNLKARPLGIENFHHPSPVIVHSFPNSIAVQHRIGKARNIEPIQDRHGLLAKKCIEIFIKFSILWLWKEQLVIDRGQYVGGLNDGAQIWCPISGWQRDAMIFDKQVTNSILPTLCAFSNWWLHAHSTGKHKTRICSAWPWTMAEG